MMRKGSKSYVVELDNATYYFADGHLEKINDLNEIDGDKWFITDMQKAIPRAMTVETPGKYAELMVRRKLHESGEFEEPVSVITHWKKRRGKNTTDIFFTAVPTSLYQQYSEQISTAEDNILLFPLYAVLFSVLKDTHSKRPVAVVFQYSRFAELIIGNCNEVFYANRCLAFDTSEEQILALWDLVRLDIKNVEAERRINIVKIVYVNWIDSAPLPEWPQEKQGEFYALASDTVTLAEQAYDISFFRAASLQSGLRSSASLPEKTYYYARRWAPWMNVIFIMAIALMLTGYFWSQTANRQILARIDQIEQRIAKTDLNVSTEVPEAHFNEVLTFIQELEYCTIVPGYRKVISDISEALSGGMELEVLKIDYADQAVNLEFFGRTLSPFDEAHHGYQHFLQTIKSKGYLVVDSRFETEIKESQLLIKLKKRFE